MSKRNITIDSLEGIGMLSIIFVHFAQMFEVGRSEVFSICGARSVQLMFIISGFLTCMSLEKTSQGLSDTARWYKKKIIRLYPSYWIFMTIYIVLAMSGQIYADTTYWSTTSIIINYVGMQGLFPNYINIINVNWFFGDIVLWYLVAPYILKKIKDVTRAVMFLLVYGVLYGWAVTIVAKYVTDENIFHFLSYQCLLAQLPYLAMGILIFYLWRDYSKRDFNVMLNNVIIVILGCIFLSMIKPDIIYNLVDDSWFEIKVINEYITWGICWAILFWTQLRKSWKVLVNKIWATWGKYSLGVYLSHLTIIRLVYTWMIKRKMVFSWYLNLLIYVLVCVLSLFSAVIIEDGVSCIIRTIVVKYCTRKDRGE